MKLGSYALNVVHLQLHPLLKFEVKEPVEIDDAAIRSETVKVQAKWEQDKKLAFLVCILTSSLVFVVYICSI